MKIIIITISLCFSILSTANSEIKSCKVHKKSSDEYKICVKENIKARKKMIVEKYNKANSIKTINDLATKD